MLDVLCRLDWQAFVSLSFPDIRPGVMAGAFIRERMLFAWLRRVGHAGGRSKDDALKYPWAVRAELGEGTGRFHYHPLLGGLDPGFVRRFVLQGRSAVGYWWENLGGGTCRTSAVFNRQGVVEYFEKCSLGNGGFEYEAGRFSTKHSILSNYAVGLLSRFAMRGTDVLHTNIKAGETGVSIIGDQRRGEQGTALLSASSIVGHTGRN